MEDQTARTPILIFDGYHRKTGKRSIRTTFKIFEDQQNILKRKYVGYSSVIIRILLEKFLGGELPDVEEQLEKLKKQASDEIKCQSILQR
jgi:hypothetical protein